MNLPSEGKERLHAIENFLVYFLEKATKLRKNLFGVDVKAIARHMQMV